MNKRILDMVCSPQDIKCLTDADLYLLANEIREEIITVTSQTGGHVASSLGAVEIMLAVHSLIDSPRDKVVFDVGHQAYAHKLLTGRLDEFSKLRTYGGISGFPKPEESPHDMHPSGHASDSLSVALGLAKARDLRGSDERVIAVIGDAALSGGMAFEALNQIGQDQTPMVIILNDNEMSISRNVGALMKHLGHMRASSSYRYTRDYVQEKLESRGRVGQGLSDFGKNWKEAIKQMVIPRSMIFEQLGIICTAPIDGHDIGAIKETLSSVLESDVPVLMHVVTKKGAGYEPAERSPEIFHGVAPFDIKTGKVRENPARMPSYTEVFSDAILAEAEKNKDIVAITAAMKDGTGLHAFAEAYPDRFIDAGIAEEHAVGMASGLALGGKKPVVALYSTFMQRSIDQLIINNALPNLDVVFCLDRAGLVGEDGPTHHGVFDIAYARMIPHVKILAPSNGAELTHALHTALDLGGPFVIRYPRGEAGGVDIPAAPKTFELGKSSILYEGKDVAILAFGRMVSSALKAADILKKEDVSVRVVDMRWVKPLDNDAIKEAAKTDLIITVEEGVVSGGVGEGVLEMLSHLKDTPPTLTLGLPDEFVEQGKNDILLRDAGLDEEGIVASIKKALL